MITVNDLMDWLNAEEADRELVTSLRASAIEYINEPGGRYFGPVRTITDFVVSRGGTFLLSNEPKDGVFTVERHDSGAWSAVDISEYVRDGRLIYGASPSRFGSSYSHLKVTYQAGFEEYPPEGEEGGAPEDVKQAVKMLVAHWFLNRETAVVGSTSAEIAHGVNDIMRKYR